MPTVTVAQVIAVQIQHLLVQAKKHLPPASPRFHLHAQKVKAALNHAVTALHKSSRLLRPFIFYE